MGTSICPTVVHSWVVGTKCKPVGSASCGLSAHFPPAPGSAAGTIPCLVTQPAPNVLRQMGGKTLLVPRFSWISVASNAAARLSSQEPSLDKTPKHGKFPAWPLRAAARAHPQLHGSHLSPSMSGRCWVLVPCVVVSGMRISRAPGNGMFGGENTGAWSSSRGFWGWGQKGAARSTSCVGGCSTAGKAFWPRGSTSLHAALLSFHKENRTQTSSLRHLPPRVPAALSSGRAKLPAKLAKPMAAPRLPATLLPANCVRKLIGAGGGGGGGARRRGAGGLRAPAGPVGSVGAAAGSEGGGDVGRSSREGAVPVCRSHVLLQTPRGFSIGGSGRGRDGGVMSCPFSTSTPMRVYLCIRPSARPSRGGGDPTHRHPAGRER